MADVEKLAAEWSASYNKTVIIFAIVNVVLIVVLVLLFTLGILTEITKNFSRYRCNPLFMPFAANFGYDASENLNFCLTSVFNTKAQEIFSPIYKLLAGFNDIVKLIVNVALSVRTIFGNFLMGVNKFVRNVRDRIQTVLFTIRMTFLKMMNLMRRVYATMYAVIWMGLSATTAGFNITDNSLVKFIFDFCFDPSTPITMADGSSKRIDALAIGDVLAPIAGNPRPVVTSTFLFDGTKTPMVNLHGVCMSAEHYVRIKGEWMPARDADAAIPCESIPTLACINVTGHTFEVGGLVVADYDEHSSSHIIEAVQSIATYALNGKQSQKGKTSDYALGVDKRFNVRMADGTWKSLGDIQIGDVVANSGKVLGVVQERATSYVRTANGLVASSAQLFWYEQEKKWNRNQSNSIKGPAVAVYSLITERCSTIEIKDGEDTYWIRDYREVPLPDMEDPYASAFHTESKVVSII
jgi:hypothetical protein